MMSLPDPVALLEHLRSHPAETEWFEFKVNKFDANDVGEYVSALANSAMLHDKRQAYLVFGVADGSHELEGTSIRLKQQKVGGELFEHWLSRMLTPRINVAFEEFEIDGKHVEIVCVEPAYDRPVRFMNVAYVRVNSVKKRLDEFPEKERTLWYLTNRYAFEEGVAATHLAPASIAKRFFVLELADLLYGRQMTHEAAIEAFVDQRLLIDDSQGGYDITNLFALCAARRLSEFKTVAGKAPRVIVYKGNTKQTGVSDVTGEQGYAVAFSRLLKYLMDTTGGKEEMLHGIRKKVTTYPELAVREFLANTLIHQDLVATGRPTIEIFAEKIVFTNPGTSLVALDRLIDAPARSRNEHLAGLMRKANLCEERGSGIDRALWEVEEAQLAPPLFAEVGDATTVTMFSTTNFAAMSKDDRIRACYQHATLRYLEERPMSNGSLRERLGLNKNQYPQVSNVINDALAAGLIRPLDIDQGNRQARYVPHWAG
jgi:ATP-dependent DNA helicase RecG